MNQNAKVLNALKVAGKHGVHSHHIRTQLWCAEPARRINDLEQQGYQIEHRRERRNGANGMRYILLKPESGREVASLPVGRAALSSGASNHLSSPEPVAAAPVPLRGAAARLEVVLDLSAITPQNPEGEAREFTQERIEWEPIAEFPDGSSFCRPKADEQRVAA